MSRLATRIDYGRRIAQVGGYIADHLDDDLDIERLADVAHFSAWHFHRIYREATGETLAGTVRRLRLHRAAVELVREDAPLEQVARRAGYGTLSAFSRAFAADYGQPPGAYRQRGRQPPVAMANPTMTPMQYEVEIDRFAGMRLAAVAHHGDYQGIGRAFERLYAWAGARAGFDPETPSFGIYYDDPESVPRHDLRSHAGLALDAGEIAGDGIQVVELPTMRCASVVHQGDYATLEVAYRFLYRDWLPASGCEPDDHPCFEAYLNNPRECPPSRWRTRIYLPIKEHPQ